MTKHYSRVGNPREALEQSLARAHKWLWLAHGHADRVSRRHVAEDLEAVLATLEAIQGRCASGLTVGSVSPVESRAHRQRAAEAAAVERWVSDGAARQRLATAEGSQRTGAL